MRFRGVNGPNDTKKLLIKKFNLIKNIFFGIRHFESKTFWVPFYQISKKFLHLEKNHQKVVELKKIMVVN